MEQKASEPHREATPNLGLIKRSIGPQYTMMAVAIGLKEVNDWFNLSKDRKLSSPQIAILSEEILNRYYDYSMAEIKHVLRRNMRSGVVYNRLDGNVIMRWFAEYDLERDNASETARCSQNAQEKKNDAISHAAWLKQLKAKAESGDSKAIDTLACYNENQARLKRILTPEQQKQREVDFHNFQVKYNQAKKQ